MMKILVLGLVLISVAAPALADDAVAASDKPKLMLNQDWPMLAANEIPTDNAAPHEGVISKPAAIEADNAWFTPNKVHKYLGLGSLGLVGLALMTTPDSEGGTKSKSSGGIHHDFAVGATALGAAAVATGFAFHRNDIDLSKGFKDPDNLHMLLGTLAEVAFIAAVSQAPASGHAGMGALGAVAMATAIKIEW